MIEYDFKKDEKINSLKTKHELATLEEVIEGSFDGILVTDGEGNVLMMNQSYVRNTGIKREELLGKNVREFINPVWMKNSVVLLTIEQRQPVSLNHTTKNSKNIMVTGTPLFNKDGSIKLVVVNTRDISEIYELREELLKAKEMEKYYLDQINGENVEKINSCEKEIVVANAKMQEIYALAGKVAAFDTTVLITGESGVGKELVARFLHNENPIRNKKPFIEVNCGAIPENLLESELFGYVEGSFTGANKGGKKGLFEAADGGTLFLDEMGEMSLNLQVKLLRVLETRTILRVGSSEQVPVDIRIIAATNKKLLDKIEDGSFRDDLYYRLNVINIEIPPLRERIDEIAPLALKFINRFNEKYGQNKKLTYEIIKEFEAYPWKGNIRQLKNIIENMVVLSNGDYLQLSDIPWLLGTCEKKITQTHREETMAEILARVERHVLQEAKEKYGSTRKIAVALDMDQSTVVRKQNKYGI
ncbi:MAG: sigma 54-interacting transcriptional regulator [Peptostreptococcaceae bacterium]|nr:sigma 54-interacting transcriptional regulator [Peptostreptococcaceae bacterium]